MSERADFFIVGAGIIGLAVARALRQKNPSARIVVLEKESRPGCHASGRNSEEVPMTQQQFLIKRKLSMMELAQTLGRVSETCRELNVSRQHFYDVKKALAKEGVDGLVEKARTKARMSNRMSEQTEDKILDYGLEFPTQGQVRVANDLKKMGVLVSAGGIRSVWLRHGLEKKAQRLARMEKWVAENGGVLTESQV